MREYNAGKIEEEGEERGGFTGDLAGKIKEEKEGEERRVVVVLLH